MSRPQIFKPQLVPVTGNDAHLPAVPEALLTPAALRERFAQPPLWEVESAGDGGLAGGYSPADASVLVPLVMRDDGLHVLLTRRAAHLRAHPGQISFPGGRAEADDGSAEVTALRETEEEIGLSRSLIDIIGRLPIYTTVTAFRVTPCVALVHTGFQLKLDDFEVAEAFEVPLQFLMDPANHRRHRFESAGKSREFLSMPWANPAVPDRPDDYFIWGATAAMLRNFYRFLRA